jgi:hypothetical protein
MGEAASFQLVSVPFLQGETKPLGYSITMQPTMSHFGKEWLNGEGKRKFEMNFPALHG